MAKERRDTELVLKILAGAIAAAGVAVGVWSFATVKVCDQQLTDAGAAVPVCRHLQATDPPVIAVGLVVLASLGAFFTEISGFGLSFKRQVQDARDAAESAEGAAESASADSQRAKKVAALAQSTADNAAGAAASADQVAQVAEELYLRIGDPWTVTSSNVPDKVADRIQVLAEKYQDTRDAMPAGSVRTAQMTSIVSQMIAELSHVSPDQFNVSEYLESAHRGKRLAGYAFLYAIPDPRRTQELVDALSREDKPFGQYWALRALRKQLQVDPTALDLNTKRQLEQFATRFGPKTDRAHELRQALAEASDGAREALREAARYHLPRLLRVPRTGGRRCLTRN